MFQSPFLKVTETRVPSTGWAAYRQFSFRVAEHSQLSRRASLPAITISVATKCNLWTPPLRESTPCRPKKFPLVLFRDIQFWQTDPKNFQKAPCAPKYTTFNVGARTKKNDFLVKRFQKVPKNALLACFLKFACSAEISAVTGSF